MHALFQLLAAAFGIASLVGWVILLIDAFQDAIWKGIASLLCGFYMLYYALFEYESDNKILILLLTFGGGAIAGCLASVGR